RQVKFGNYFIILSVGICRVNTQLVHTFNKTYVGFPEGIVISAVACLPVELLRIKLNNQRIIVLINVHNICPSEKSIDNNSGKRSSVTTLSSFPLGSAGSTPNWFTPSIRRTLASPRVLSFPP